MLGASPRLLTINFISNKKRRNIYIYIDKHIKINPAEDPNSRQSNRIQILIRTHLHIEMQIRHTHAYMYTYSYTYTYTCTYTSFKASLESRHLILPSFACVTVYILVKIPASISEVINEGSTP